VELTNTVSINYCNSWCSALYNTVKKQKNNLKTLTFQWLLSTLYVNSELYHSNLQRNYNSSLKGFHTLHNDCFYDKRK